jgi:hypothetical protein
VREVTEPVLYRYSTASRSSRGCNYPGIPAESVDPLWTSGFKGVPGCWLICNPVFPTTMLGDDQVIFEFK